MKFENFQVFADGLHKNHLVPHIARLEEEEKKGTLTLTKKKHSKKRHTHTHLVPHVARLEKEKKYEKNE